MVQEEEVGNQMIDFTSYKDLEESWNERELEEYDNEADSIPQPIVRKVPSDSASAITEEI